MASRPTLKDRLFTLLCTAGAIVLVVVGLSRGNWRLAVFGALFFAGYAVLHGAARRLTPAARLVSGVEADDRERRAQFRATVLTGQVSLGVAVVAALVDILVGWAPGLWIAGTALLVIAVFVGALSFFGRRR